MQVVRSNPKARERLIQSFEAARRLDYLRDRELSLITICSEAPKKLATIRAEIAQLEERRA